MALSSTGFAQQPNSRIIPALTGAPRVAPIDETADNARPIPSLESMDQGNGASPELTSTVVAFSPEYRRRQNAQSSSGSYRPSAGPDSTPRQIYNPRGAPSDAIPAMSQLEARIAFEPVYMQHYASTLYTLVSRIPTTLAERRQAYDLLA